MIKLSYQLKSIIKLQPICHDSCSCIAAILQPTPVCAEASLEHWPELYLSFPHSSRNTSAALRCRIRCLLKCHTKPWRQCRKSCPLNGKDARSLPNPQLDWLKDLKGNDDVDSTDRRESHVQLQGCWGKTWAVSFRSKPSLPWAGL